MTLSNSTVAVSILVGFRLQSKLEVEALETINWQGVTVMNAYINQPSEYHSACVNSLAAGEISAVLKDDYGPVRTATLLEKRTTTLPGR